VIAGELPDDVASPNHRLSSVTGWRRRQTCAAHPVDVPRSAHTLREPTAGGAPLNSRRDEKQSHYPAQSFPPDWPPGSGALTIASSRLRVKLLFLTRRREGESGDGMLSKRARRKALRTVSPGIRYHRQTHANP
jgi:hypothetical protein